MGAVLPGLALFAWPIAAAYAPLYGLVMWRQMFVQGQR
jgi:hypothetical protein